MSRLLRPGVRERLTGDPLVVGVIVVLSLALAAAVLALVLRGGGGDGSAAEEAAALAAARRSAVSMTSYDHRTLDRDFGWVRRGATARFAAEYRAANRPLRDVIEDLEATARGSVGEAAATARGAGTVEVVMFVDQRITNGADASTRRDSSRVVMTMVLRDGRWLVDDVELL